MKKDPYRRKGFGGSEREKHDFYLKDNVAGIESPGPLAYEIPSLLEPKKGPYSSLMTYVSLVYLHGCRTGRCRRLPALNLCAPHQ